MRRYLLATATGLSLALSGGLALADGHEGMGAAKKWIDEEFQPSVLSKEEQMAEMASSSAGYQNPPGTKAAAQKKAPKTEFDMTRQMGPDQRDPRLQKETWPCFGTHIKIWGSNRYGKWEECATCGLRLTYTPAVNAPGQTSHVDLVQNVQEALHRLRTDGHEANSITGRQVKAMITIVSKEKVVTKKSAKAKAKAPPSKVEPVDLAKDDSEAETENFQVVNGEQKKGRHRSA